MHDKWSVINKINEIFELSPEELEAFRWKEVEALIQSAPEKYQRRLRGIQFQVDAERAKHASPMGACIAISDMMQTSLKKMNAALQGEDALTANSKNTASVIPFAAS